MAKAKTKTKTTRRRTRPVKGKLIKVGPRNLLMAPMAIGFVSQAAGGKIGSYLPKEWLDKKWGKALSLSPNCLGLIAGGFLLKSDDVFSAGVGQLAGVLLGVTL